MRLQLLLFIDFKPVPVQRDAFGLLDIRHGQNSADLTTDLDWLKHTADTVRHAVGAEGLWSVIFILVRSRL